MPIQPLFAGLVFDQQDRPVEVAYVGEEPCYVVDDDGFRRHISSEYVDRQVLGLMGKMLEGNENLVSEQTAKMMGQDDIFSIAMIAAQLKQIDKQFDSLLQTGIPADMRSYLGMMGFKIRIDLHGEVIDFEQPGMGAPDDDSGEL